MLNCQQVSQLVSESTDRQLSLWTRINLWMHLGMCGLCRRFRKVILRVDLEARAIADDFEQDQNTTLPQSAAQRIRSFLDPGNPESH